MWVHRSHDILQTLCRVVLALWPPKASQWVQQRREPLLRWPLRLAEVEAREWFVSVDVFVSEIVAEAVSEFEAV